jgi:hypothetical protein
LINENEEKSKINKALLQKTEMLQD